MPLIILPELTGDSDDETGTIYDAPTVGTTAQSGLGNPTGVPLPNPAAPSSVAAFIPDAAYGANATISTIAQTKYGAPVGWTTPAGTTSEGYLWVAPWGNVLAGSAPDVFRANVGDGISKDDAAGGGLAAASYKNAMGGGEQGETNAVQDDGTGAQKLPVMVTTAKKTPWGRYALIVVGVLVVLSLIKE